MTFSNIVKDEFLKTYYSAECCSRAFLSAIIHTAGTFNIEGRKIFIEINSRNIKLIERCRKEFFNKYRAECVLKSSKYVYTLILDKEKSLEILNDLYITEYDDNKSLQILPGINKYLAEEECCNKAYLKGAFLGSGTIAIPNENASGYQLEFNVSNEIFAKDILELLSDFELQGNYSARNDGFVVYLKNSETISDFLALLSASKSVIHLQELILKRQVSNLSNRQNNCYIANAIKNFDASIVQVNSINIIEQNVGIESLNKGLRQAAKLRLENPESSIEELALLADITKSGMNHRLRKINEIAEKFKID